jgi:anti-anti-sigma factor
MRIGKLLQLSQRTRRVNVTAMPIEKWSERISVVHLSDDPLFSDDMESLEEQICANHHPCDAVLDFSSVKFLNSSNVGLLLKLRKEVASREGKLVLCGVGTQVWGTFLVTGLDKLFEFSDNVPTALATLQIGAAGERGQQS